MTINRSRSSAAKSTSSKSTAMKYKPKVSENSARSIAKGTKPLAEAASIQQVLVMMVVHVCRKIMYTIDVSHKVGLYMFGTLIISIIGDFLTKENSKFYMARPDNLFNVLFVKWSWGWTLTFVSLFVGLTSFTTSCGRKDIIKNQGIRLVIGTLVWFCCTTLFEIIEHRSGICSVTKYLSKGSCAAKGFRWRGFDISGHTFLLIWNNLFIVEEGKAYLGWERIKDMLRNEEHKRLSTDLINPAGDSDSRTALSKLKADEFLHLRTNYRQYTPWVRLLFGILSFWHLLWDIMLFFTILYFHITLEKIIGASIAILIWFLLYRVIYTKSGILPGDGLFKYVQEIKYNSRRESLKRPNSYIDNQKWTAREDIPTFMGMPVYSAINTNKENEVDKEFTNNVRNARKTSSDTRGYAASSSSGTVSMSNLRSRSRSASRTRMNSASRNSLNIVNFY